ncbi:MAG: N-acetyl-gamma-glutamyl-phosphate reductase [Phycisphaerales bacterium]
MKRVAIVGLAGYTGQELARLIVQHPDLELAAVFGSSGSAGIPVEQAVPSLRGVVEGRIGVGDASGILDSGAEIVFLATPHEASAAIAGPLLDAGRTVIDLSAAFRLRKPSLYPTYYAFEHPAPALLDRAVYGLPERSRRSLRGADLVAVPGCYPTSIILALAPLADGALVRTDRAIVADSTSGVSGAGRKASDRTSFCEVSQSPYGVFTHRHGPEIDQECAAEVIFTPHLGPYARGICSTIHAELRDGVDEPAVRSCLQAAYADEPFVRLLPAGSWPSVAGVERTNFIDIGLAVHPTRGHLVLVSCIDNLLKGASGQAVQALNAVLGLDERIGLPPAAASGGAAR